MVLLCDRLFPAGCLDLGPSCILDLHGVKPVGIEEALGLEFGLVHGGGVRLGDLRILHSIPALARPVARP